MPNQNFQVRFPLQSYWSQFLTSYKVSFNYSTIQLLLPFLLQYLIWFQFRIDSSSIWVLVSISPQLIFKSMI